MAMWYYAKDRQKQGPVSEEVVVSLVRERGLSAADLVWCEGWADWKPVGDVPQLAAHLPVAGGVVPPPPPSSPMPAPVFVAPPAQGKPKSLLVWAILATLFCCLPFGVAAIIFAAQVDSKWNAGDHAGAIQAAEKAKLWCWVSFGVGIVATLGFFVLGFVGALAEQGGF